MNQSRTSFARVGHNLMANVSPKVGDDSFIQIPSLNDQFEAAFREQEHFHFGSPSKPAARERASSSGFVDALTQQSTPGEASASDHSSTASDFASNRLAQGPKNYHRDVYNSSNSSHQSFEHLPSQQEEATPYQLIQNVHIGASLKPDAKASCLFSNSLLLQMKQSEEVSQEDMKKSEVFRLADSLQATFDQLEFRENEEEEDEDKSQQALKFDFESEKGNSHCKQILFLIESLFSQFNLPANDRAYRQKFTKAYKILYAQNGGAEKLNYLPEILDSAQENYPHLWVNGEKYVFSDDVIEAGEGLFRNFLKLRDIAVEIIEGVAKPSLVNLGTLKTQLKLALESFDAAWTMYEQLYVYELMVIETDARRFIIESIKVEQELQDLEGSCIPIEKLRRDSVYNDKRKELVEKLSQINTVCNMEGKGRDDLIDIQILTEAEGLVDKLKPGQAPSMRVIAEKIQQSFHCFRILLNKYRENIDAVDPQLKNNQELAEMVVLYEDSWTMGRDQLLDVDRRDQLLNFCGHINHLGKKYPNFKEQVECSEAEIFLSIPSLLVLKSITKEPESDSQLRLCRRFLENPEEEGKRADIDFSSLSDKLVQLKGQQPDAVEQLEQFIIEDDDNLIRGGPVRNELLSLGQHVKENGMALSRVNAQEFNQFISAALGE